jgi:DNA polymerase V
MLRNINPERDRDLEPLHDPGQVSGFSSPAQDYKEDRLHIIQKLVKDPTNTFYFEADNDDLIDYGIKRGAVLIVDKSVAIHDGRVVVAFNEGEWVMRQLTTLAGKRCLVTKNLAHNHISVTAETVIFGVVTWSCNPLSSKQVCLL